MNTKASEVNNTTPIKRCFTIAASGASGAIYTSYFLQSLSHLVPGESSFIMSPAALRVYRQEANSKVASVSEYLDEIFTNTSSKTKLLHQFRIENYQDIGARCASGSAHSDGMIIVPCSMKSIAGIAHGYSSNLIERAADVCLKERRRLVVVPRETPYSTLHLQNMLQLSQAGGIVLPASPGFYQQPQNLSELACFIAGRILSLFEIDHKLFSAWNGQSE